MNSSDVTYPDFPEFRKNFEAGKTQLAWHWLEADLETPVAAYLKLCHAETHSFLLESVEGGTVLGRYSAIGLKPDLVWRYEEGDTLEKLKNLVKDSHMDIVPENLPPMAPSGLFGFIGYDMVRLIEDIPDNNPDPLNIPQSLLIRPSLMAIFDNVKNMMCLSTPVRIHARNSTTTAQEAYDEARSVISNALHLLGDVLPAQTFQTETSCKTPLDTHSNHTKESYGEMVETAMEYIRAGDIFQVVPSQRFCIDFDLPPFDLYRTLRRLNPSPFLFYLNFGEFALVGASPEILVRVRDGTVTIRAIAGTRRRGATETEDRELAEELLNDPKERAEHLMLLDLARNDVGKVAEIGSVTVTEQFIIERYSHVMHIVSNVEGQLHADLDSLDALFSGFPAGTVSGAPKIRAMEIIDELENERRSFYAGCVGYLDGHGNVDTCITLRTALVKDGKLYVQAGGGVVADSDPEAEYQESCNKARAIIEAAEMAVEKSQGKKKAV